MNCSYCCCSRSWSFSLNYFRRTKAHKKENFPKTIRLCVFACDSTRYNNNSNNKKTKRYISSSVRHFDNVFAQILFRVRRVGGTAHKVKIEGPDLARLFSSLLFTSRLFYAEKGHCETKPKTERSITNSSHLGLGLFRLSFVSAAVPSPPVSPSSSPSLFFDLVVYRFLSTYAFLSVPFFSHATHIFPLLNNETVHYADISLGYPM